MPSAKLCSVQSAHTPLARRSICSHTTRMPLRRPRTRLCARQCSCVVSTCQPHTIRRIRTRLCARQCSCVVSTCQPHTIPRHPSLLVSLGRRERISARHQSRTGHRACVCMCAQLLLLLRPCACAASHPGCSALANDACEGGSLRAQYHRSLRPRRCRRTGRARRAAPRQRVRTRWRCREC